MSFASTLILKICPLYLNILLGFIAGKLLQANRDTIARIMFYMINPIVIFNGVLNAGLEPDILLLPVVTFVISSSLCLLFYNLSKKIWQDTSKNLMAFSAGSGNTGYFGLPVALILFSDQGEGAYIMAFLGMTLYENSLGFYICAKGIYSASECFWKLIKLPSLYAFLGGLAINYTNMQIPEVFVDFMVHIKGTYTVLGMMIIGLGLAALHNFKLDFKFIGMAFLAKFVAWPAIILTLIFLDNQFLGIFSPMAHNAMMLVSIVPLAVNTVVIAALLHSQPEKAATSVLLSTIFALFYVPFMAAMFIL